MVAGTVEVLSQWIAGTVEMSEAQVLALVSDIPTRLSVGPTGG
ncbi:hypothetical protein [Tsukamurella paurometabola]|uniref:Uncharacterized protein n=1 Tax=Tsukamurella paurometabola TaxID=2061 RepID=A0A3P8K599_TSUPA|nr:hypothetical protein [Tsukamurella paurometabola]VDR40509.1 Uncharacterised protein [Tsukamurella paurometabola]